MAKTRQSATKAAAKKSSKAGTAKAVNGKIAKAKAKKSRGKSMANSLQSGSRTMDMEMAAPTPNPSDVDSSEGDSGFGGFVGNYGTGTSNAAEKVVLQHSDGRLTAEGIIEAAKNYDGSARQAEEEYLAIVKTENQNAEAKHFALLNCEGDSDLKAILCLLHLRNQVDYSQESGRRKLAETKEEQAKELAYLNKNADTLIHRCPASAKTADTYVAVQWLKSALKLRSLDYLIGMVAIRNYMTKDFSNKTTFAGVDLRKASMVKTNRSSELYAGDLAIANAIILGVFAHEKANKANREKLLRHSQNPEEVVEHVVTTFTWAWEPNADMEDALINLAETNIQSMWDIRDSYGNWTVSAFRKYFEDTLTFVRVVDPSKWEKRIMQSVKRQLANVDTRTQDAFLPMYQLLVKRLERDHSNLNLSGASGATLCSTLAFRRALDVIIENLQAASSLEVSQRKKIDPFSLQGKHMDENEDNDLDDRAMHLSGAGRGVRGNPRKGPKPQVPGKTYKFDTNQCFKCGASAYGPGGHFARNCPNAPNSSGTSSGSNAASAATTSAVAAPVITALADAGANGNASGTVNRAIVDKAVESARDDFEEHVLKGGSFYVEDLERMKHSHDTVARPHLERIAALEAEHGSLRARPGSAASSGNGAAAGASRANAAQAARGQGRGRGRGPSAADMAGARETLRLAESFQV